LEARGEAIAGTLNPQEATNILWAFATLKRRPTARLLEALERHTEAMASRYNSQNVANTLWAYASIRTKPGERLASISAIVTGDRVPKYWINISHSHKYPAHAGYYRMRGISLPHYFLMTILTFITSFVRHLPPIFY
jgi:hypothetical protein